MVRIWGIVIVVHATLLALMIVFYDRPNLLWNKKPVVIRTVLAAAPRPKAPASAQKTTQKTTGGKETVKASPKKKHLGAGRSRSENTESQKSSSAQDRRNRGSHSALQKTCRPEKRGARSAATPR